MRKSKGRSNWTAFAAAAFLVLAPAIAVLLSPDIASAQTSYCNYYQGGLCCNCEPDPERPGDIICAQGAIVGYIICDADHDLCDGECVGG